MLLICVPKVFDKVQVHSVPRKIHESMDFSHTKVQQNKFFVDSDGFNQDFYTQSPNNPRWTMRPPAMRHICNPHARSMTGTQMLELMNAASIFMPQDS